jgi:molybdopterin synthase catalytic subunit
MENPATALIELTRSPIDVAAVLAPVQSPAAGAAVLFLGTTREFTGRRQTVSLTYEAYEEMARKQLQTLATEACRQWALVGCAVVHRLGKVPVGDVSVAIAVSSAHRNAAFEAGKWLIDRIKEVVPIWKEEFQADGTRRWIHPGLAVPAAEPEEPR